MACDSKAASRWTARVIPLILLGLIGYAAWVLTKLVCADYLLQPPQEISLQRRLAPAIVVLVLFYLLLLPVLICYGRLIQTIVINPGYTPRGPSYTSIAAQRTKSAGSHRSSARHRRHRHRRKSHLHAPIEKPLEPDKPLSPEGSATLGESAFGEEQNFWKKDIFICNFDGRPNWCSTCMSFKTDRTHHCRETDRCVRKMDHFCPWVGGIISETSFKYFIQFTTYAAVFCSHVLITMAILVAERKRKLDSLSIHWCIVLGLSALFLMFSSGMSLSSLQLAYVNSTTVENLSRKTRVWFIAVLIPRPQDGNPRGEAQNFLTITYPRPPEEQQILQQQCSPPSPRETLPGSRRSPSDQRQNDLRSAPPPSNLSGQTSFRRNSPSIGDNSLLSPNSPQRIVPHTELRTFAILQSQPGQNPFDLGPLNNLKEVLGYSFIDWFLPLKPSPCTDHTSYIGAFKMGKVVEEMKRAAGLYTEKPHQGRRRKRRRKPKPEAGRAYLTGNRVHRPRD